MQKRTWLLLVVAAVLLATVIVKKVSAPAAVSGGEVPRPAAAAASVPVPRPQPVELPCAPAVEASEPQPLVPDAAEVAAEIAAEIAAEAVVETAPVAPEQKQPASGDRAPTVEAIIAGAGGRLQALVGDTLVSEGSMVQGYRVRKVQADGVVFEKDGQLWVQKLN